MPAPVIDYQTPPSSKVLSLFAMASVFLLACAGAAAGVLIIAMYAFGAYVDPLLGYIESLLISAVIVIGVSWLLSLLFSLLAYWFPRHLPRSMISSVAWGSMMGFATAAGLLVLG